MNETPRPLVRVLTPSADVAKLVVDLARLTSTEVTVHVCQESFVDAVAIARAAKPELPLVAIVEGKNAAVTALGSGVDEVIELAILSPELLAMATRLASERARFRSDREDLERTLAHREKLAALGTVVAGVAHEINNPAAAVLLNLEGLAMTVSALRRELSALEATAGGWDASDPRAPARPEVERALGAAHKILADGEIDLVIADSTASVKVIVDVVRDLRVISRGSTDEAPPEVVDLRMLVNQVLRLSTLESDVTHVELDFPDDVPLLWLPRSRLMQIVTNLVANAGYAMRSHPRPLHRLRVMIRQDDTSLMLAIADTGAGISVDNLNRMFEPFYTTKGVEHGTGLGLFMSREIVRKLGGDLTIDSVEGEGTTAMIFLPLELRTLAMAERRMDPDNRPRVLVVDDDLERLRTTEHSLRAHYDVLIARGGVEALDVLESGSRVDALLCELHLHTMNGRVLYERIEARWPSLANRIVFFTSDASGLPKPETLGQRVISVLAVPTDRGAVIDALRSVLTS